MDRHPIAVPHTSKAQIVSAPGTDPRLVPRTPVLAQVFAKEGGRESFDESLPPALGDLPFSP